MKHTILLFSILIQAFVALAQGKRDYQWRFGDYAGVSFSGGAAVSTTSSIYTDEGNATISDTSGHLLFYTNGLTVWTASNSVMPNGTSLLGSDISDQSALIVPSPSNSNQYYLFTVRNWDDPTPGTGLAYSIVDMTLNGGLGDVTAVKNVPVNQTSWEQLTALMSSDGQKIWIVTHDNNSQNFRSYLLSAAGFNTSAVISSIGSGYTGTNRFGQLHFSKACKPKLVSVLGSANDANETVQLFDFDMSTGIVSNVQTLATYNDIPGAYGCAFSPDNTKLYVTQYNSSAVYQFDLTNANIASTMTNISPSNIATASTICQAPDGKLYLSMNGQNSLSVILSPNAAGVGCNFLYNVLSLSGGTCTLALPNFTTPTWSVFAATDSTPASCGVNNGSAIALATPSDTTNTYLWSNGATTDTLANIVAGTYTVTITDAEGCSASATALITNTGGSSPSSVQITGDTSICTGNNAVFNAIVTNPVGTPIYQWMVNSQPSNIHSSSFSPLALNNNDTIFCLLFYNGCTGPDTAVSNKIIVSVNSIAIANAGQDVAFCSGDSATIGTTAVNGYTYLWTPETGLSNYTAAEPYADGTNNSGDTIVTQYILLTSNGNCFSHDTVIVSIYPKLTARFVPPLPQCWPNNNFTFSASGSLYAGEMFYWNFGTAATPSTSGLQQQNVTFPSPGLYPVTLTINTGVCGNSIYTDSVIINSAPLPLFNVEDPLGCPGASICFTNNSVSNTSVVYTWQFGDGIISHDINPCHVYASPGSYNVRLTATSVNGCRADTIMDNAITIVPTPAAAFGPADAVLQLPEDTLTLWNQSSGAVSYLWNFAGNTTTVVNPIATFSTYGSYPVILWAYNIYGCYDSVEHYVIVLPPDNFFIPNIFTPNGDGINDEFYVFSQEGVTVLKFEIFDRWGEKVYDGLQPWDGTFKGKPCQEGVYVYYIQLQLASQMQALKRKGSITLLR